MTTTVAIPPWDSSGVLPPIWPGQAGASPRRAPYQASVVELVESFSHSQERRDILRGLIELRRALAGAGLNQGFQWIDGSFVENVEELRGRPPADIDVVTFVPLGDAAAQQELVSRHPGLFDLGNLKLRFSVDGYYVNLGDPLSELSVRQVTYWYSMWAHRRTDLRWKGFVHVPLSAADDEEALRLLDSLQDDSGAGDDTQEPR